MTSSIPPSTIPIMFKLFTLLIWGGKGDIEQLLFHTRHNDPGIANVYAWCLLFLSVGLDKFYYIFIYTLFWGDISGFSACYIFTLSCSRCFHQITKLEISWANLQSFHVPTELNVLPWLAISAVLDWSVFFQLEKWGGKNSNKLRQRPKRSKFF